MARRPPDGNYVLDTGLRSNVDASGRPCNPVALRRPLAIEAGNASFLHWGRGALPESIRTDYPRRSCKVANGIEYPKSDQRRPVHTSDSIAYLIDDALFTGDSLFMPDGGTARCDFSDGDAAQLYRSIQRLLALPDATRIFVCHDYGPGGRAFANETTISEQRAHNIHVHDGVAEAEFVSVREARDATLAEPKLMQPAVKANIQGGA